MTVRCSQGHENPDGSAFCDECGEPLAATSPVATASPAVSVPPASSIGGPATGASTLTGATITCPQCGAQNAATDMFCSACGMNLAAAQPPTVPQAPSPPPASATQTPYQQPTPPPAPVAVAARLVVDSDNFVFDLPNKNEVLVGREDPVSNAFPDLDLTPHGGEEGGVSRMHAKIIRSGSQFFIEDQNSTNFTFLNRQRLQPKTPTPLKDGDEIRLGRVVLHFRTS
jgi:hypothetical protein